MKKLLSLFLLLFSLSKSYSQGYTPFPPANAVWTTYYYWCGDNTNLIENRDQIYFNGDTIINGLVYQKLAGQELNGWGSCEYPFGVYLTHVDTISYIRFGYLRQDTTLRRVYYLANDSSAETILYDFNLSVGDTITQFFPHNCMYDTVIVKSIDTFYSDKPYRRYNFHIIANGIFGLYQTASSWIEGIGSDEGLLYSSLNYCGNQLTCFSRSDSSIYPFLSSHSCPLLTTINEISPQTITLNLSPNPTTNICTINFNDKPGLYTATITDITGREIMPLVQNQHISTYTFNTTTLPPGLYFIKLSDNTGHFAVSKLIKE